MKFTNYSNSVQGVRSKGRLAYVQPGQEVDLDLTPEETKHIKTLAAFAKDGVVSVTLADTEPYTENEVDSAETEEEKAEEGKDVSEKDALIAQLAELGVTADKRSNVATLTAKLEEAKAAQ